jgi:hypothetical protein
LWLGVCEGKGRSWLLGEREWFGCGGLGLLGVWLGRFPYLFDVLDDSAFSDGNLFHLLVVIIVILLELCFIQVLLFGLNGRWGFNSSRGFFFSIFVLFLLVEVVGREYFLHLVVLDL